MSRLIDDMGAYVRFRGACDAGYLKEILIVARVRWTSAGKEFQTRTQAGDMSPWMPATLFELVNKPG